MGLFTETIELDEKEFDRIYDEGTDIIDAINQRFNQGKPYDAPEVHNCLEITERMSQILAEKDVHFDCCLGDKINDAIAQASVDVITQAFHDVGIDNVELYISVGKERYNKGEHELRIKTPYRYNEDEYIGDILDNILDIKEQGFAIGMFGVNSSNLLTAELVATDELKESMVSQVTDIEQIDLSKANLWTVMEKDGSLSMDVNIQFDSNDKESGTTNFVSFRIEHLEKNNHELNEKLLDALDDKGYKLSSILRENQYNAFWEAYRANNTACKENTKKHNDIER